MPAGSVADGAAMGPGVVVPWFCAVASGAMAGGVVVSVVCAYARPIEPAMAAAATETAMFLKPSCQILLEDCLKIACQGKG